MNHIPVFVVSLGMINDRQVKMTVTTLALNEGAYSDFTKLSFFSAPQ
jgi:hypothetical protein